MENPKHIRIAGSEKKPLAGARVCGTIDPRERIEITVLVRARRPAGTRFRQTLSGTRTARNYFTREEWDIAHGADPADLLAIEEYASRHGLDVTRSSSSERRVVLSGEIGALTRAFPVKLRRVIYKGKAYRERTGAVSKPEPLGKIITDVKGFDNRPQASPPPRPGSPRRFLRSKSGNCIIFPPKATGPESASRLSSSAVDTGARISKIISGSSVCRCRLCRRYRLMAGSILRAAMPTER